VGGRNEAQLLTPHARTDSSFNDSTSPLHDGSTPPPELRAASTDVERNLQIAPLGPPLALDAKSAPSAHRIVVLVTDRGIDEMDGVYARGRSQRPSRIIRLLSWVIVATIIAAFFWIQIQIDHLTEGLARSALLLLSFFVELGLIMLWNKRFERFIRTPR
jgi:hypothetical protein